jgi:hypothetical protein
MGALHKSGMTRIALPRSLFSPPVQAQVSLIERVSVKNMARKL